MKKLLLHPVILINIFSFAGVVFVVHNIIYFLTDWYNRYPSTDIIFHFLGGFAIAHGFLRLISLLIKKKNVFLSDKSLKLIGVLALVALSAMMWEFGEYSSDAVFGTNMQPSLNDTMMDMFLGLLGGFTSYLVFDTRK